MKAISPELNGNSCRFNLWAPLHKRVEVQILHPAIETVPMTCDEYGYWSANIEGAQAGTLYRYTFGGPASFPDPASLSQPEGVHGPSEVIDLKQFRWTDGSWRNIPCEEMIFYEIHTGTFSGEGNFEGIIRRLDHLLELGVNSIELMPVGQFPGRRNWGYDCVSPYAVQNSYGGAEGLFRLVDACHRAGLAVILDVIYNHLGPDGNYLGEYGPYFTDRYKTPWGRAINYDDSYAYGVRNFVIQNAVMWLEDFHIDGLRLDAVHAIYDFSARHIMQELAGEVAQLSERTGKPHYLIAESALNDSRYIKSIKQGGYGLDAQWDDDFHHGLHTLATGEKNGYYIDFTDPRTFVKAFTEGFAYDGQFSSFRKRNFGNSSKVNPGRQFVVYSQNHDQTGNRKFGERLSRLVSFEMLKVIAGAVFLSPFLPLLFMGEEYGEEHPFLYFVDHTDKKLNVLVREGRTSEFKAFYPEDNTPAPDPSDFNTFAQSRLTDDPLTADAPAALFRYYRTMIRLRKSHPVLKHPDKNNIRVDYSGNVLAVERWHDEGRIIAWLNFGHLPAERHLPASFIEKSELLMDSSEIQWKGPGSEAFPENQVRGKVTINGESIRIYSR